MKKILFVDDMIEIYNKISDKIQVDYSDSEEDAIKKINSNNYDLVVSDYHLGKNSPQGGLNVIQAAKRRGIEKIILISKDNHERECLDAGADEFVFKMEFIEEFGEKYGKGNKTR